MSRCHGREGVMQLVVIDFNDHLWKCGKTFLETADGISCRVRTPHASSLIIA